MMRAKYSYNGINQTETTWYFDPNPQEPILVNNDFFPSAIIEREKGSEWYVFDTIGGLTGALGCKEDTIKIENRDKDIVITCQVPAERAYYLHRALDVLDHIKYLTGPDHDYHDYEYDVHPVGDAYNVEVTLYGKPVNVKAARPTW